MDAGISQPANSRQIQWRNGEGEQATDANAAAGKEKPAHGREKH